MTFTEELQRIGIPAPPEIEHIGDARRVTDWARRCGISRSLLNARCRENGYLEPVKFIQLRRVVIGLRRMEEGERMAVAAREAGYPDEFTFSNQCMILLGKRPSALRAMDWRFVIRQTLKRPHG